MIFPHGVKPPEQFLAVPATEAKFNAVAPFLFQSLVIGLKETFMAVTPPGVNS